MEIGFEIVTESAKRKRPGDAEDAPSQVPMRPEKMARNPSTDQKRVRRQMARQKVASKVAAGQWKIEEDTGSYSGRPMFTLFYMGPEDSPGYGVWEPVKTFPSREEAEAFKQNPPAWWGQTSASRSETMDLDARERELLAAMAKALPDERVRLDAELQHVRAARLASRKEATSLEFAEEVVADHLTPVLTHVRHSAETDWMDAAFEGEADSPQHITNEVIAEASLWFNRVHPAVKYDAEEFSAQAQGMARRTAGRFGDHYAAAQRSFMDQALHLRRRLAESEGWPVDPGTEQSPNVEEWLHEHTDDDGTTHQHLEELPGVASSFTPQALHYAHTLEAELLFEADGAGPNDPATGQSTITDYERDGDDDPMFSEDWPGADPSETSSERAPVIQENKDGSNSERNQEVHGSRHVADDSRSRERSSGSRTCPTCGEDNLTEEEARKGYQCRSCTRRDEGYGFESSKKSWRDLAAEAGLPPAAIERIATVAAQHNVPEAEMPNLLRQAGVHVADGGYKPVADPSGQGQSSLPTKDEEDEDDRPMWPWELDTQGKGAADVADVRTPGGERGYPQPKRSSAQQAFRNRVQASLRESR